MTSFRFHRGTLTESLKTAVPVQSVVDVRAIVEKHLNELGVTSYDQPMYIDFYGHDTRIQKNLFSVRLKYYGLVGWVDEESTSYLDSRIKVIQQ